MKTRIQTCVHIASRSVTPDKSVQAVQAMINEWLKENEADKTIISIQVSCTVIPSTDSGHPTEYTVLYIGTIQYTLDE